MRYLPASPDDVRKMLSSLGIDDIGALFESIPGELRPGTPPDLPPPVPEGELKERFISRSIRNASATCRPCFLGAGAYDHVSPSPIDHLLLRTEFLTTYTPYQPEMAQGTLQAIFEFQTMMADLTGMDVSNASLYDGASAAAEAALMALRIRKGNKILVARSLHPAYREVLRTYLRHLGAVVEEVPFGPDGRIDREALAKAQGDDTACLLVGQPNFLGVVEDMKGLSESLAGNKPPLLVAVVTEALSLAILEPPGALGADIVAGEARSFGLPLGYGGPYLGFITTKKAHTRQLPGRICGETLDADGRRGFVLTLSTREQHIRREKATSNICTNEGLCMLAATIYLALQGRKGLRDLALQNLSRAEHLKGLLGKRGFETYFNGPTFNEFTVRLPFSASRASEAAWKANLIGGLDLARHYPEMEGAYLLCATETVTGAACERMAAVLGGLK